MHSKIALDSSGMLSRPPRDPFPCLQDPFPCLQEPFPCLQKPFPGPKRAGNEVKSMRGDVWDTSGCFSCAVAVSEGAHMCGSNESHETPKKPPKC